MIQIGLKKLLWLKKLKILCCGHILLMILKAKRLLERFMKTNNNESRVEKVINRKDNQLYVNWKCYDNSFNSWIDKKDRI